MNQIVAYIKRCLSNIYKLAPPNYLSAMVSLKKAQSKTTHRGTVFPYCDILVSKMALF